MSPLSLRLPRELEERDRRADRVQSCHPSLSASPESWRSGTGGRTVSSHVTPLSPPSQRAGGAGPAGGPCPVMSPLSLRLPRELEERDRRADRVQSCHPSLSAFPESWRSGTGGRTVSSHVTPLSPPPQRAGGAGPAGGPCPVMSPLSLRLPRELEERDRREDRVQSCHPSLSASPENWRSGTGGRTVSSHVTPLLLPQRAGGAGPAGGPCPVMSPISLRLPRELEERDRRADRVQMEHERRLVAAREQAERAVREIFDKLQHQLDRQQQRLAEVSAAGSQAAGNTNW